MGEKMVWYTYGRYALFYKDSVMGVRTDPRTAQI